ncbi:rhodanese-like domain-containing protein [Tychonema sp. LEGE 06208]|uniref:rhodanese-like domain-containing protein n=1 Tax=Tychonema sp. LEGE 06208 TaxID=1828663 RepID=UPI001D139A61|nr:rhodanese-like domain-containing protein [Tychonema sp. LEGE 06208]
MSEKTVNLESTIDRFLTSIPPGYYTIANVEGLKKQLKSPQTLLVDVREPSEYKSGHIPDAINIPLQTLAHNLEQIPHDRSRCAVLFRRLSSGNGSNDTALIGL